MLNKLIPINCEVILRYGKFKHQSFRFKFSLSTVIAACLDFVVTLSHYLDIGNMLRFVNCFQLNVTYNNEKALKLTLSPSFYTFMTLF